MCDPRLKKITESTQMAVRVGHADRLEAERLARSRLTDAPDVIRTDRRELRVAARRLPVDQQDDGLAVAGHLHRSERDAIRDDVMASRVLDARPAKARAHPVGLRQHLIWAVEQRPDPGLGETIVLRPEDEPDRLGT